jgi:hypothetical protein
MRKAAVLAGALVFCAVCAPVAFAHEEGGGDLESPFESVFFTVLFGILGIALYAGYAEKNGRGFRLLEAGAAFFGVYFGMSFLFNSMLG